MGILWNDSSVGGGILWDDADTNVQPSDELILITAIDAGNASADLSSVTDPESSEPLVWIDWRVATQSAVTGWRYLMFAVENAEGKEPLFRLNRASMNARNFPIRADWLALWTTDFVTYHQATSRTLSGGDTGYIEFQFDEPLPAGRVYVMTHPMTPNSYAQTFTQELLTNYSSVVQPAIPADSNGVYNTSPAETDENGRPIGENDQYALRLSWGGATTDGGRKRKLVLASGIHAAGEQFSWTLFEASVRYLLEGTSQKAQNLRANFDVFLFYNLTPNGIVGGHSRWNFRISTDPNRDFINRSLQEIDAFIDACIAATGGEADAFISYHTWQQYPELFIVAAENPPTPQLQAMIDYGFANESLNRLILDNVAARDVTWAANTLGCTLSVDAEIGMRSPTILSVVQDTGVLWMEALEEVDSQGLFVEADPSVTNLTPLSIEMAMEFTKPSITQQEPVPAPGVTNLTPLSIEMAMEFEPPALTQNHVLEPKDIQMRIQFVVDVGRGMGDDSNVGRNVGLNVARAVAPGI